MADQRVEPPRCSVCERSMLAGERTRTYVTGEREHHEVCDLCLVRAESAGWVAMELADGRAPERSDGRGAMRRLFGRARESASAPRRKRQARDAEKEEPRPSTPAADATDGSRPERPRSVPQNPKRRIARALESFNGSAHRSTVRGLIRSLGGPYVSATTTEETPGEVRITIAWELSWYQYAVDLTSAGEPVREVRRGNELSELAPADQDWNAHAAEDGELRPGPIEAGV